MSLLNFDDCVTHAKIHYRKEYPVSKHDRATFGNVPRNLHKEITQLAEETGLQLPQVIAALYDFLMEHEEQNKEMLDKIRKISAQKVRG